MTNRTNTNINDAIAYAASDLSRTDTKAGLLLTLDGLLVAALGLTGTNLHDLSLILAIIGAVALIGGVVLALLVIRPRIAGGRINDRASYAFYATAEPGAIAEALADDRRPARLAALSTLTLRKMKLLALAGDTTLVAVVAIAAAVLTR
ncbi:Pycsar system effector family protein [Streptomyces sp. NPDC088258]|uniref:Pycsar system effector family protein n=1 Tax=Streptomyces sp. NPDC088258 TaxID=3365849 RepID=UPI0037F8E003